jgi:sulfur-carrier protein
MRITYFAWLKTKVGHGQETVTPPDTVRDVAGLLEWLKGRDEVYAAAFANTAVIRVAVNQDVVERDSPIGPDDDVALFPPVTGG